MNNKKIFICAIAFVINIRAAIPDGEYYMREVIDDFPPTKLTQEECTIRLSGHVSQISISNLNKCIHSQHKLGDLLKQSFGAELIDPTKIPVLYRDRMIITAYNFTDQVASESELELVLKTPDFIIQSHTGRPILLCVYCTKKPNVSFLIWLEKGCRYILSSHIRPGNYMSKDLIKEMNKYFSGQDKRMHIYVSHEGIHAGFECVPLTAETLQILLDIPHAKSLADIAQPFLTANIPLSPF